MNGSQSQNYFAVTPSWRRAPSGNHDQIFVVVKIVEVLFAIGRPPSREDGSVL
jgi:hypothetical protein